jgi:hypothetical protein
MEAEGAATWLKEAEKARHYVHRYLRNLRKYGLAFKNEAFWFLTPKGAEFVKYLDFVNSKILEYGKKVERKEKENRKKEETKQPKTTKADSNQPLAPKFRLRRSGKRSSRNAIKALQRNRLKVHSYKRSI